MISKAKTPKILIIEDSEDDVFFLQQAFESVDLESELNIKHDGETAIDYLSLLKNDPSSQPDLIILDLNLPRKSGKDVLRILKKDPDYEKTPVIILSTSTNPKDIEMCYKLHSNSYVVKPNSFHELVKFSKSLKKFWFETSVLPSSH
ncbi:MAG: response regulator [Flavobacteriales bacterium]|nr:response regulator [Flavobacteriales bacterium]